ncbi:hypothetical protein BGZ61DRAFT_45208 [Ilyonectria robusta]|uniref:uncharacterized protein n=1 Tax=Ilyonectria robusta TaxID=1079257 RepID=UPI001E8E6147|nr:uncharacterized protein BGZ61DRAFT_45208 [Ilyonectria robusta]KAH8686751.1 hypothetical protein BGZ61DRAFT_45208 [Ilyonectria robusta]
MSLKDRISSPLEAGISILDAHNLPPHIMPALEWASSRLARKSLHVTVVVARRDYQLPSVVPPLGSPGLPTPTTPMSPGLRFHFSSGPVSALKQLVRSGSYNGPTPMRSTEFSRNGMASPKQTTANSDMSNPRMRWPMSPATPLSPPPMTPCTASTTTTDTMSSMMSSAAFGMRLVHAGGLPPKTERALRSVIEKAEKKFRVGPEWLSPSASPPACGLTNQLVHRSIIQNEVLFSSEGLTLLSLDRLYSLKSALSSYSKTKSPLRLEDAVDELRRIILANNGAKVTRSDILRSYDWLSVSHSAIAALDRMYRRAYGGPEQLGGISGMTNFFDPVVKSGSFFDLDDSDDSDDSDDEVETEMVRTSPPIPEMTQIPMPEMIQIYPPTPTKKLPDTPSPKPPLLKLQTNFEPKLIGPEPKAIPKKEVEEDGDRTARPTDRLLFTMHSWTGNGGTIDQVLSGPVLLSPSIMSPDLLSPDQSGLGPTTPNGYDDISPTTRGEWGFLMVDDAFQGGRTVAVETC